MKITHLIPLALVALAAACAPEITAPRVSSPIVPAGSPSALLGPDEGVRIISNDVDAFGNTVMIAEYAAGVFANSSGQPAVASVTIKTIIPQVASGSSKTPCITSTIVAVETTTGWTSSVKKPGGCDKPIEVQLVNASTKQRADFSFLYQFGKTRIDSGLIK